ncbi:serine protease [uncultured Jannaschia sp.]|uniref:trypsin-like serine peptidase n=1 Tax=uncultured Jannaschia sp. TaxID=293347 RepID=UPI0026174D03|nr:serine protease [uncultured Jannaschia sp.]
MALAVDFFGCKISKVPIQMVLRTLLWLALARTILSAATAHAQWSDEANPAIGRLNYAGFRNRQHCTAALVGPREALTAKHCVDGLAPGNLHVLLGYDGGTYSEHLRVRALQLAPDADIARLCLDRPSSVEPLSSFSKNVGAETQNIFGAVTLIGYPRSQAHSQQGRRCAVTAEDSTLARLDCPAEPGMSGAPVLSSGHLIGIMSASATETSVAVLVTALPPGRCNEPDHFPDRDE